MLKGSCSNQDGGYVINSEIPDRATWKWHFRSGHHGKNAMKALSSFGTLGKEQIKEIAFCEECVMSKQHRENFPKGQKGSKEMLEYIHSDL